MNSKLDTILNRIGDSYRNDIQNNSRFYVEVNIGREADKLGFSDMTERYGRINALVPLKKPVSGMKVRVDGRTFVNYAQFDTGVVIPGYITKETEKPYKTFIPNDSMILNFA